VLLVFLFVDFGLSSLLIGRRDPALAEQGKTLEDLGKKLASRATRDFLPETLRLAEEMERLGNELQRGELNRDDAMDQLDELADQAEEQSRQMQQQMDQNRQSGNGTSGDGGDYTSVPLAPGGPGDGEDGETVEGLMDSQGAPGGGPPGQQMPPGFQPPGADAGGAQGGGPPDGMPPGDQPYGAQPEGSGPGSAQSDRQNRQEIDNLRELEEALRNSAQQLAMAGAEDERAPGEEDPSEGESSGSDGSLSLSLQDTEGQERSGPPGGVPPGGAPPGDASEQEPKPGEEAPEGAPRGSSPGTQGDRGRPGADAARDAAGEAGGFADLSREETSEIESTPGEGDTLRGVLRAFPLASSPQKPLEDVIADYSRQLEENIDREAVPLNFKQYIRDYFVVIGILGEPAE
jgi:hypothetical protein